MKNLLFSALILSTIAHAQLEYPQAKKITQLERRFGALIEDPYKWMENPSDPDLWDWIEAQKNVTANVLNANLMEDFAQRTLDIRKLRAEQSRITNAAEPSFTKPGLPTIEEDLGLTKKEKRFVKWKTLNTSIEKRNYSKKDSDTYSISTQAVASGDLTRVIISNKADNKLAGILLVKFYTFVAWADNNSFYYISDLDERIGGGRPGLFKHTVGSIQSEDQLILSGRTSTSDLVVHEIGDQFYAQVDESIGSLHLASGRLTNKYLVDGEIIEMTQLPEVAAVIRTFKKTNNGEIHKLRLRDGDRKIFIPEQDFVVEKSRHISADLTLLIGLKDGAHVAGIRDFLGNINMIDLSDGTIDAISFKEGILKLGYESYREPRKILSYDVHSGELKTLAQQELGIEIEADKIYYTAANGQKASMWVMRKKGVQLTKSTPTILYGYGGFRVSITPAFGIYESLSWMDKGGAFAVVTLPGSLDYGQSWYEIARVGQRFIAWDSFAAAGKELIHRGWTSSDNLGMMGASNGGTLTAGTLQRHSEIFKAAVPIVGVMDLLNFTLFTAGKYWTDDYGNPFIEKDFLEMYVLSPYHNIEKRPYPATMVMTAEFDDRVVPMHSYKYLARLQEYNTSNQPILLYNKEWGGHSRASGSPRESSRFVAAFYTFFAQQLGL